MTGIFGNPITTQVLGSYSTNVRNLNIAGAKLGTGQRFVPGATPAGAKYAGGTMRLAALEWGSLNGGMETTLSLAQTGQVYIKQLEDLLVRMKEIAIDVQDPLLSTNDIDNLEVEYQALHDQIDNIGTNAEFNGTVLLTGALSTAIRLDPFGSSYTLTVSTTIDSTNLTVTQTILASAANGSTAEGQIDAGLVKVQKAGAKFDAAIGVINNFLPHTTTQKSFLDATVSSLLNVNTAQATSEFVQAQLLVNVGQAVISQANNLSRGELAFLQTI